MSMSAESKREYQRAYMQNQRKNKGNSKQDPECPGVESTELSAKLLDPMLDPAEMLDPVRPNLLDLHGFVRPEMLDPLLDPVLDLMSDNVRPDGWATQACTCKHCRQLHAVDADARLNHGAYMSADMLKANGYYVNRVSLPGDLDHVAQRGVA